MTCPIQESDDDYEDDFAIIEKQSLQFVKIKSIFIW